LKIQIVQTTLETTHKFKDNIKTDLKEMECVNVYWIQMTKDKVSWQAIMNMVINLWVPKKLEISSLTE
jgi:hypothetical protein